MQAETINQKQPYRSSVETAQTCECFCTFTRVEKLSSITMISAFSFVTCTSQIEEDIHKVTTQDKKYVTAQTNITD